MKIHRKKNFILGIGSGYLASIVSIVLGIISVPIGIKYFGVERYGALAIINTLITYLSISNFGIPTAAGVLAAKAGEKIEQMKVIVKSFILLIVISLVALVLFLLFASNDAWVEVLGKIPNEIYSEVRDATFVAAILFLLNVPFSLLLTGFTATQRVYIERLYSAISVNSAFPALLITIWLQESLVTLMLIRGLFVIAVSLISSIHFLFFYEENRSFLKDNFGQLLKSAQTAELSPRSISVTGFRFFAINLAAMVVWQTDNLVISHFLGIENVASYSITFKLLTTGFILFTAFNGAFSPMIGNATASGDFQWIQKAYNKLAVISSVLGGLVWVAGMALAEDIINVWVGPVGFGGPLVVFALGGYGYALSLISIHSSVISSMNLLKNGIAIGWSEAMTNLALSLILVKFFGIAGVALGTFFAAATTVFWMTPVEISRRTDGKVKFNYIPVAKHFFIIVLPLLAAVIITAVFIDNKVIELGIKFLIIGLYILFSYKNLTEELKIMLKELAHKLWLIKEKNRYGQG